MKYLPALAALLLCGAAGCGQSEPPRPPPAPIASSTDPDVDHLYPNGHDVPGAMAKLDPSATPGQYAEILEAIKRRHPGARRSSIAKALTLARQRLLERGERQTLLEVGNEVLAFVPPRDGVDRRPDIGGAYYIIEADEGTGEDGS